jgi:hypothetical protein
MAGEFLHSSALIYLSGVMTLAAGLAILNVHHLWTRDWRVFVTIFGGLLLVGGILRILAMSWAQSVGESLIAHRRWPLAVAVSRSRLAPFSPSWAIRTPGTAVGGGRPSFKRGKELWLRVP